MQGKKDTRNVWNFYLYVQYFFAFSNLKVAIWFNMFFYCGLFFNTNRRGRCLQFSTESQGALHK